MTTKTNLNFSPATIVHKETIVAPKIYEKFWSKAKTNIAQIKEFIIKIIEIAYIFFNFFRHHCPSYLFTIRNKTISLPKSESKKGFLPTKSLISEWTNTPLDQLNFEQRKKLFCRIFSLDETLNLNKIRTDIQYLDEKFAKTSVFFYPTMSKAEQGCIYFLNYKADFAFNQHRIIRFLKKAQTHNVIVRLVDSIETINKILCTHQEIDYVEFGAHGTSYGIHFVQRDLLDRLDYDSETINRETINQFDFQNVTPGASIILSSCATGQGEDNIAQKISALYPEFHVFAPDRPISGEDIQVSKDEIIVFQQNGLNITKHYYAVKVIK